MEHPHMEDLDKIEATLRENDKAIPDVIRAAVGLEHHYKIVSVPSDGEIKIFANSLLRPPEPVQKHGDGDEVEEGEVVPLPQKRKREAQDGGDDELEEVEVVPSPKKRKREVQDDDDDDGRTEERDGEVKKAALRMDWKSCYVPHHNEDAHFDYDEASVVAVADGVDAGAFARGLMARAHELLVTATEPAGAPVCPYTLLERAYNETAESGAPGASTAVILSLAGDVLKWAYVGDSAFAVLRDGKIVHRSEPQTRYFNAPCYLRRGGGVSIATAKVGETPVRHGDVVVAGTDGLFNNVSDADLEKVVQIVTALGFSTKNMVDLIAGTAYEMSRCTEKDSPFAVEGRKQKDKAHYQGGKIDDITVVVARIVSADS